MKVSVLRTLLASAAIVFALLPGTATALMITLSDMSSDGTPAGDLDATLDFTVLGGNTLQIVATNDTTAPNEFNINAIWWNGSDDVTSLTLTSATHSVNGNVFADWDPVDTNTGVNGFGTFEFGLTEGVGETNPSVIQPGNSVTFVLSISGACANALDCDPLADFLSQTTTGGKAVAGKFVSGPDDPESPGMEDSAFGASGPVPEPGTAVLLGLALTALALRRRA